MTIQSFDSPYGELIIGVFREQLVLFDWRYRKMRSSIDDRIMKGLDCSCVEGDTALIRNTIRQPESIYSVILNPAFCRCFQNWG